MAVIGANAVTGAKLVKATDKRVSGDVGFGDATVLSVSNLNIEPDTIQGDRLADAAITSAKLGAAQVTSDKLKANARSELGFGTVTLVSHTTTDWPSPVPSVTPGLVIPAGGKHSCT